MKVNIFSNGSLCQKLNNTLIIILIIEVKKNFFFLMKMKIDTSEKTNKEKRNSYKK